MTNICECGRRFKGIALEIERKIIGETPKKATLCPACAYWHKKNARDSAAFVKAIG